MVGATPQEVAVPDTPPSRPPPRYSGAPSWLVDPMAMIERFVTTVVTGDAFALIAAFAIQRYAPLLEEMTSLLFGMLVAALASVYAVAVVLNFWAAIGLGFDVQVWQASNFARVAVGISGMLVVAGSTAVIGLHMFTDVVFFLAGATFPAGRLP